MFTKKCSTKIDKMKAVLFGGNGFIGSHLGDALLDMEWDVVVFDREKERFRDEKREIRYIYGDFEDRDVVRTALEKDDVVFHLIGTTLPTTSNENPASDVKSNVMNTIGLLEECVKASIKKIIFLSSGGTIYGIPKKIPVSERHPTNPICSYGITKLMIEKYIHLFHYLYGLSYAIIRGANPFGERQNPLGQQGAIAVFLGKIAREEPLIVWGDGNIVRDYFYVEELVRALIKIIDYPDPCCLFNIGSGVGYSLKQILDKIAKVTEKEFQVIYKPGRKIDVPQLILDTSKAKKELNWSLNVPLEEGIAKVWRWIQRII
jgi:UDP-glucose 4-epimerase